MEVTRQRCEALTKLGFRCRCLSCVRVAIDGRGIVALCSKHHALLFEGLPLKFSDPEDPNGR